MSKIKVHNNVKTLRKKADKLWSFSVKRDWGERCAVCGNRGGALNAHHLIPRQHYGTRYDIRNGICLCYQCHTACPKRSPHLNADGWMEWLHKHHPETAIWYHAMNAEKWSNTVTKNAQYFRDVICELKQYVEPYEFEQLVGFELAQWLEENE